MHSHNWECSDTPGVFICQCHAVAFYNRATQEKEVQNV